MPATCPIYFLNPALISLIIRAILITRTLYIEDILLHIHTVLNTLNLPLDSHRCRFDGSEIHELLFDFSATLPEDAIDIPGNQVPVRLQVALILQPFILDLILSDFYFVFQIELQGNFLPLPLALVPLVALQIVISGPLGLGTLAVN